MLCSPPRKAEGFGLPLVEAAQHGLPIIARDIPLFREVAGEHAYYFLGEDPKGLANTLRTWLSLGHAVPASTDLLRMTWQQSSRQLLDIILGGCWISRWPDAATNPGMAPLADRSEAVVRDACVLR